MALHRDYKELLEAFAAAKVDYLIVGGYAVAHHARPRYTKDIDLLIRPDRGNIARAVSALVQFGAPEGVTASLKDAGADDIVWMGHPPLRVDILQSIPGVDFDAAWARRIDTVWDEVHVHVISRSDLIRAKQASGRPQDMLDVEQLLKSGESDEE